MIGFKSVVFYYDRDIRQRLDRINPARTQENESRPVPPGQFEQVNGAVEIVFDQLPAARLTVDPGEHARIGRGVDDPIDGCD